MSSWCNGQSAGLRNRSKWVRTPVLLLRLVSDKYSRERYEPPYPPSYGLNSTTTVLIGQVGRVFANGPGDLGSIPGHVIPKTLKMVLDTSLLNTQQYKVGIKGKVEQSRKRSSASPTLRCSSFWKGSLLVTLDYGRQQLFFLKDGFGIR